MRLNENTVVFGDKVILVPYRAEHVPTYHEWMKSPELLELTASEPLSLEEEYDMQRKWHEDEDKLTFILLARPSIPRDLHDPDVKASSGSSNPMTSTDTSKPTSPNDSSRPRTSSQTSSQTQHIISPAEIQQCKMVGDINLFLPDGVDGDGECEIMIANPQDRKNGYAKEALSMFLTYTTTHLPFDPTHLIARIGSSNTPSTTLFKRLGFGVVKVVEVFDQVEMRWQGGQHPGEDVSGEGVSGEDMLGESLATRAASGGLWGVDLSDRVGPYDR